MASAVSVSGLRTREDDLKAALVMSFARFTNWPSASLETPLTIGVLGDDGLLEALGRITAGKSIQGRVIQVRSPRSAGELRSFQMLYAGTLEKKKLKEYLAAAREGAVLTMGESPRFLPAGGIVRLFEEDGHLSFEVNLSALSQAGLDISSKLLRLGYTIRDPASVRQKP
ncbi:MAG: YfiR family protein [bacterium]